jgi:hypothetical protein
MNDFGSLLLSDILERSRKLKKLSEDAMAQVDDRGFFSSDKPCSNSLAIIVKHMSGNFRSRWTGFLISDGEKPDRERDSEFVIMPEDTRDALVKSWDLGWEIYLSELGSLCEEDFSKNICIRGKSLSVLSAITRAFEHVSFHSGQIVYISKAICCDSWTSLSIARGKSQEFNDLIASESARTD